MKIRSQNSSRYSVWKFSPERDQWNGSFHSVSFGLFRAHLVQGLSVPVTLGRITTQNLLILLRLQGQNVWLLSFPVMSHINETEFTGQAWCWAVECSAQSWKSPGLPWTLSGLTRGSTRLLSLHCTGALGESPLNLCVCVASLIDKKKNKHPWSGGREACLLHGPDYV